MMEQPQAPQMDPLQQAQGEVMKLKMMVDNLATKLARREIYIADLESDNQVMMSQLQQMQGFLAASQQPAVPEQGDATGGGETESEASNVIPFPGTVPPADEVTPELPDAE